MKAHAPILIWPNLSGTFSIIYSRVHNHACMNSRRSRSWLDRSQAILGSQSKKHGGDDHHVDARRPPGACQRPMTDLHVIRALTGSALSHSGRPTRASRRVLGHDSDRHPGLTGSQRACGPGWGCDRMLPPVLNPLKAFPSCRSRHDSDASH